MPYQLSEDSLCVQEQQNGEWVDKKCYSDKVDALAYLRALETNVEDVHKMSDNFNIFIPLVKVDEQKRMIYGRAAQEVPDGSQEIMDYASSKPNFLKWSGDALARTQLLPEENRSLGNVRVMHEPYAAGKVTKFDCNDLDKAFDIATYIHDDNAWDGVLKGIYTGFSIGGSYEKRWRDFNNPRLTRYTANPVEVSLVDAPAIPTATFKLIKTDGSEELRKFSIPEVAPANATVENPTNPPVEVISEPAQEPKIVPVIAEHFVAPDVIVDPSEPANTPLSEPIGVNVATPDMEVLKAFTAAVNELVAIKKATDDKDSQTVSVLKALGLRVGIARRESEPLAPPTNYPVLADDYADPANWSYPCDSDHVAKSIMGFNLGRDRGKYSEREWHVLGRRIVQRINATPGTRYSYHAPDKQIRKALKMDLNKGSINELIPQIASAIDVAVDQIGKDPSNAKAMLMQLLGSLNASENPSSVNTTTSEPIPPHGGAQGDGMGKQGSMQPPMTQAATEPTTTTSTPETMAQAADAPSESTSSSTETDVTKALTAKVDALTELVTKFIQQAAPQAVQKAAGMPIGDIAALIPQQTQIDPVIAALTSGDKNALRKAAEIAGTPDRPDLQAVRERVQNYAAKSLTPSFTQMGIAQGLMSLPTFTQPPKE